MIRQQFDVDGYWKVIIYYNISGDFFFPIFKELESIGYSSKVISDIFRNLSKDAKAVTCSSSIYSTSIVLFNKHETREDYINSIVHEAEHIKQAMLEAYDVEDKGEPPAYTIGYLVMKMWEVFRELLY